MTESEMYLQSVVDAFECASKLLWENVKPSEFVSIATELQRLKEMQPPTNFWHTWPKQPTSFTLYFRAGMSALDVAERFRQSIDGCIQIAKVETAGNVFDYGALDEATLRNWMVATMKGIADICSIGTGVERYREVDLMRRKILLEVITWRESIKPELTSDSEYQKAIDIRIRSSGMASWPDICEQVTGVRDNHRSFAKSVRGYALKTNQTLPDTEGAKPNRHQ